MHPDEEVLGAVGLTEMIVRPGDTSVAIGIGDLPIIAPSLLINLMEHAAVLSLDLLTSRKTLSLKQGFWLSQRRFNG